MKVDERENGWMVVWSKRELETEEWTRLSKVGGKYGFEGLVALGWDGIAGAAVIRGPWGKRVHKVGNLAAWWPGDVCVMLISNCQRQRR